MSRRRSGFSLFVSGLLIALFPAAVISLGLYLELAGTTATGVVTDRHQEIRVWSGEWMRTLRLEV